MENEIIVADDDFRALEGPSIATIHRQWLDRGLPSHTYPKWLAQYGDAVRAELQPVEHTHHGICNPSCRRWGS